jgi:hypothetical protein
MSPFSLIVDLIKRAGHVSVLTMSVIHRVASPELIAYAVTLVGKAAEQFALTHLAQRREFVIAELMKLPGMSESTARLLVEIGVQHMKAETDEDIAHLAQVAAGRAVSSEGFTRVGETFPRPLSEATAEELARKALQP